MKPTTISLKLTAESPIVHGAFGPKIGNAIAFRRLERRGMPTPAISGNALGGLLRRTIWRHVFAEQGLSRAAMDLRQWDRLYGALANGGHLEKAEVATDCERLNRLRTELPPLSAMGAALYSYMISGNCSLPWLFPETEGDPELLIEEVALARHVDRESQNPTVSGVTPMPVTIETVKTGTVFSGRILWLAKPWTEAEVGCIVWALSQLRAIGGKSHVGFGRVAVEHDGDQASAEAFATWASGVGAGDALRALAGEL